MNKLDHLSNILRKKNLLTGRFIQDKTLLTELVMPDMTGCTLKPYISYGVKRGEIGVTV